MSFEIQPFVANFMKKKVDKFFIFAFCHLSFLCRPLLMVAGVIRNFAIQGDPGPTREWPVTASQHFVLSVLPL